MSKSDKWSCIKSILLRMLRILRCTIERQPLFVVESWIIGPGLVSISLDKINNNVIVIGSSRLIFIDWRRAFELKIIFDLRRETNNLKNL